jgi:glycosyltransferase involved in cell wall biosynthesis
MRQKPFLCPSALAMDLSLVIPAYNEHESLPELVDWIARVCEAEGYRYEILIVDDGSDDGTWAVIRQLAETRPAVQGLRFRRNYGKSAALNQGFQESRGKVVITLDADLQDSPDEIPELVRMIREEGYDLVSGWKQKRYDPLSKTVPSKLYNAVTRWLTGIPLHDFNCGLKAYRGEVVHAIEVYGEMHRQIPLIAKAAGFRRIGEKVVQHRARQYGVTKFGLERFVNGFLDLFSALFVQRFGKRPMHLFGTLGTLSFLSGGLLTIWVIADKVWRQSQGLPYRNAPDNPLFYLALVAVVVGVQLFAAGFVAELVGRSAADRNRYEVAERAGFGGDLLA